MSAPHHHISPVVTLRITGLSTDGTQLLGTIDGSDSYAIDIDDELRTMVAGPTVGARTTRPAATVGRQWEGTMTPQLRPKEIQARIRAGASLEQVAAAASCTPEKIESFAYPVLMERDAMAQRARSVRPLAGIPISSAVVELADSTLEEIVTGTLAERGQADALTWDAFRDERGWTLTLTWQVGLSENRAEWAYAPGVDGGSVTPRGRAAAELIEPVAGVLRSVDESAEIDGAPAPGESRDSGVDTLFDTEPPADHEAPKRRKRGQRPAMPSWEDVLLGTRAAEH